MTRKKKNRNPRNTRQSAPQKGASGPTPHNGDPNPAPPRMDAQPTSPKVDPRTAAQNGAYMLEPPRGRYLRVPREDPGNITEPPRGKRVMTLTYHCRDCGADTSFRTVRDPITIYGVQVEQRPNLKICPACDQGKPVLTGKE